MAANEMVIKVSLADPELAEITAAEYVRDIENAARGCRDCDNSLSFCAAHALFYESKKRDLEALVLGMVKFG